MVHRVLLTAIALFAVILIARASLSPDRKAFFATSGWRRKVARQ
jgi:hypothetical protein